MRLLASVLAAVGLASCLSQLDVPSTAKVTCSVAQPACPDGLACDGSLGLCLPTTPPSGPGPALDGNATIQPPVIGAHQRFSVTFSTNNALIGPPALNLVSGALNAPLVYLSGQDTGPWVFFYEATGGEVEGVATIRGTLADAQGRVARDVTIGTAMLDFTAPIVDAVEVDEAITSGGRSWVDTVSITLRPVLPVGGEVPATALINGTVTAPADVAYAATLPVTLLPGDGSKVVNVQFIDAAGNVTAVAVPLTLDTATPSSSIVVDSPAPPDVYVNANSMTIFFHSSAPFPPDFDTHVFSTDGGATWQPTSTLGALALPLLAQDTTTTVWIRERDLFGNLTPHASQGVLAIHEDSQPPSTPHAFTNIISGLITSEAGILLDGARDPGGGPVTYELLGGPYPDYTPVSTEPRIVLPGATSGGSNVYVIRGVDRAGNASTGVTVTVADLPFQQILSDCTGSCIAYEHSAGSGLGVFASQNPGVNQNLCAASPDPCRAHELTLCTQLAVDSFGCSSKQLYFNTSGTILIRAIGIGGQVLTFVDLSAAATVRAMYVGADNALQTVDDGALVNIGSGNCLGPTGQGVFFGNTANANHLTFANYGADKIPGTADAGEALSFVLGTSAVTGFDPCRIQTSARHVMWTDNRAAFGGQTRYVVFNLGADGKPGTGDDAGEWTVPNGLSNGTVLLGTNRVLVRQSTNSWNIYDAGPDQVFGNGDDVPNTLYDIPNLAAAEGDKGYATGPDVMFDFTTHRTLAVNNEAFGGAHLSVISASGPMIFGSLSLGNYAEMPGAYAVHGEPLTFQVADASGEGGPSGAVSGAYYAFMAGTRATFLNTQSGGFHQLVPGLTTLADMDIDGGNFVYLDQPGGAVMLYSAGADGIPGTGDDKGPAQVAGPGNYRWPRIDGHVVVYADVGADPDLRWVGADVASSLKVLDLGADGWVGGGDDVTTSLTSAGTKAVLPDVSGTTVVYMDMADDATGKCEGVRGISPDPTSCTGSLKRISTSNSAPTLVAAAGTGHAEPQINGNRIVWSEYVAGNWDIKLNTIGGATITAVSTTDDERMPMLVGESLAYFRVTRTQTPGNDGVFVVDSGADTTFGTGDDVTRRQPANVAPRGCGSACAGWDAQLRWYDGEVTASGGGLMPIDTAFDSACGSTSLPLADNATTTDSAMLAAPTWQTIEDLRVHVIVNHPVPAQLEVRLASPFGETVVLTSSLAGVNQTFTVENAPNLFGLHGDPLPGLWQLQVQDKVAGSTGTLTSWNIRHRR